MKVSNNQQAPDFSVNDINGNPIALSAFKGQKIHLNFYRFAGCPFCNLRFHEINQLSDLYKKNNVKLISVYESTPENMKAYMNGETFYATMIPNPDSELYKLYDLDRSFLGLLNFMLFKGGISKIMKGQKLFKQKVSNDGAIDRVGAEFLIDEQGRVVNAHYGRYPGDDLPIEMIKKFIES